MKNGKECFLLTYIPIKLSSQYLKISYHLWHKNIFLLIFNKKKGENAITSCCNPRRLAHKTEVTKFFKNVNLLFSSEHATDCIKGNTAVLSKYFFNLHIWGAKLYWKTKNQQSSLPKFKHLIQQHKEILHDISKFLSVRS